MIDRRVLSTECAGWKVWNVKTPPLSAKTEAHYFVNAQSVICNRDGWSGNLLYGPLSQSYPMLTYPSAPRPSQSRIASQEYKVDLRSRQTTKYFLQNANCNTILSLPILCSSNTAPHQVNSSHQLRYVQASCTRFHCRPSLQ